MRSVRQAVFVVPAAAEVALRRGLFAAAGVEVTTSAVPSSGAQRDDLDAGRADLAITATDNLFAWNASGSDIAVIAQIETTTDLALVLRPRLESLDRLDVVRLAVDAPTNGFAIVAYAMMARLGRSPAQFEVVEVGGVRERFEALADGSVDASLLAPPLDEIGRGLGMSVALRVSELTPAYPGLGVVARRSLLDSRLDAVSGYLRVLDEANRWMREAPRDEVEHELRAAGLGPAAVASALATVPTSLLPSPDGLEVLVRLRDELGRTIPGAPEAAALVDLRALQAAGLHPLR
jgi:ABC-type nitrate/sulfonate/bicarbonate transport system substrate-binding protein